MGKIIAILLAWVVNNDTDSCHDNKIREESHKSEDQNNLQYLAITLVAFPGLVVNPRKPFFTLSTSLSLSALEICEDNHS